MAAFACVPSSNTASCTDSGVSLSGDGAGTYSDGTPTGSLTVPPLNGTAQPGGGTIGLTVALSDFRSTAGTSAPNWEVSLSSTGITVPTISGTSTTEAITLATAAGTCATTDACSGAAVVDKTNGSLALNDTAAPVIASDANGDFGPWNLTIPGKFDIPAGAVGGTYTGSVNITLSTPV